MSDIKDLTNKIKKFRDERDWKQFHLPKNLAISLMLEASEVVELFQWTKDNKLPKERLQDLKDELGDTYGYLLLIANEFNIDLGKALEEKIKKNEEKYPVEKSKGKSTKYNKL